MLKLLLLLLFFISINSLTVQIPKIQKSIITSALCLTLLAGNPGISLAKVGEGGLPDGPLAFQKLLKYQKDWKELSTSVSKRQDSIDEKEILNIKAFLKGLANEYYDMDFLSKSITDNTKLEKAKVVAKDFRTTIRKCDDALTKNDISTVLANYDSSAKQLQEFLNLLSDVPEDL